MSESIAQKWTMHRAGSRNHVEIQYNECNSCHCLLPQSFGQKDYGGLVSSILSFIGVCTPSFRITAIMGELIGLYHIFRSKTYCMYNMLPSVCPLRETSETE